MLDCPVIISRWMAAEGLSTILSFSSISLVSEGSKGEFICLDAKSFVVNRLGEVREGREA